MLDNLLKIPCILSVVMFIFFSLVSSSIFSIVPLNIGDFPSGLAVGCVVGVGGSGMPGNIIVAVFDVCVVFVMVRYVLLCDVFVDSYFQSYVFLPRVHVVLHAN